MAFRKKLDNALSGAELVHCFSTGYLAAWATEACLSKAIPLIHSPPVHFGKWGDSPLLLQSYAKANAIVCLSQSFKHEFQRLLPQARVPVYVNPAPVSLSKNKKEPSLPVPNPFILFLGRREKHKGLTVLLSAFKKILPPASLVVAGPGRPVSPEDPRIIDLGFVDEAIKNWLLDNCALLCVPSYEESFGIVFVEAMAHAKPVVAFDIAPVNEIIVHGETGLLIPAGETKEISAAIRALLNGPASAQRMGNNGYKRYCEVYEGKKVMKKIMSLYDSIVSS
jgi:glycosyltransferase involved in cell wall biosynthesis